MYTKLLRKLVNLIKNMGGHCDGSSTKGHCN